MNDPIKKFVEQNREAFDDLEAPAFNLDGFKKRLNEAPVEKKRSLFLLSRTKWLVAASLIIVVTATFLLFHQQEKVSLSNLARSKGQKQPAMAQVTEPKPAVVNINETPAVQSNLVNRISDVVAKEEKSKQEQQKRAVLTEDLYANLNDSTSASLRLAAILDLDRSNAINNQSLDRLAKTMNADGNSNVRLAALDVLKKYSSDTHVSNILVKSLGTQSDPMVQLELVNVLGKMKNLNINNQLYALANDPNTFSAVKDEAYNILLKEDKL